MATDGLYNSLNREYGELTPEEKKVDLFLRQKHTLDLFLERHAISEQQYKKSLSDLTEKMGMESLLNDKN